MTAGKSLSENELSESHYSVCKTDSLRNDWSIVSLFSRVKL